MDDKFTLRVPFQLEPGHEITGLDEPIERMLGDLTVRLSRDGDYYVLQIRDFSSEDEAKEYLNRVWGALAWAMLERDLAFVASVEFDSVTYPEDPTAAAENLRENFGIDITGPVDGLANGNMATVYPSDKHIRYAWVSVSTSVKKPVDNVMPLLLEGITMPNSHDIASDPKLRTALELYAASFYERSSTTKFLTLVMVLETLAETQLKPPAVLELISQWKEQVAHKKTEFAPGSDDSLALDALERELLFRRETSIRSRIRELVYRTLATAGDQDADATAQLALHVYDKRSTLIHMGTIPDPELRQCEIDAKQIVQRVLKARYKQQAL